MCESGGGEVVGRLSVGNRGIGGRELGEAPGWCGREEERERETWRGGAGCPAGSL